MSRANQTALIIQAADVIIFPIKGGVESKKGYTINNTDFSITPSTSEIKELTSTMRDDFGQALDTFGGEVTPAQISISFNRASPEIFALAMGGKVEYVPAESGSIVNDEFIPAKVGEIVKLKYDYIDASTFELKDSSVTFVPGEDFNVNTDTGIVEILSDKLEKATNVKQSYSYNIPEKVRMHLGSETQSSMRIEFDGINVSNGGKRVKGEIYRAMVTPSEAVNLHSNEPVVATLTGKLSTPAGKTAPFVLEMEK